jgi:hypothetical protein
LSVTARAALLGEVLLGRAGDLAIFAPTCGLPLAGRASGGKPRNDAGLTAG